MADKPALRVTLTLMPDRPLHVAAATILEAIPKGKRTAFICERIVNGADKKDMLEEIRTIIRDTIKENFSQASNIQIQPQTYQEPEKTQTDDAAEEIRKNIFGFLASLEEGDDGP